MLNEGMTDQAANPLGSAHSGDNKATKTLDSQGFFYNANRRCNNEYFPHN